MFLDLALFILGFVFLIKGADIMIDGSSSLARKLSISGFVIGLTVVAFGTSTPELAISVFGALRGSTGIVLGNIIGSNISNTLLILGSSALFAPLLVRRATVTKEIPFSLLAVLAVGFLVNDFLIDHTNPSGLTRVDGLVLILFFVIFVYYTFGLTKSKENILQKTMGELKGEEPKEYGSLASVVMIVAGLMGLVLGGYWIVNSTLNLARVFNISEGLLGLTIVALASSLPELAASIIATRSGKTDMAVGNVVGSNIFNLLFILGLSATIKPIAFEIVLNADLVLLFSFTVLLLFLIFLGKKNILDKREGIILLILYVGYIIFLGIRG